jgi:hypothetical protein
MNLNKCIHNLFSDEDLKSPLNKENIKYHRNIENPWILLNNNVYSIKNDDNELLEIFKDYYAKDIKKYLLENFNNKERILLLNKLKDRKIGFIK